MFPFCFALFASLPLVLAGAHAPLNLSGSVAATVSLSSSAETSPASYPSKQCVRDKCSRQVADGLRYGASAHSSDCAALFETVTVTPSAKTTTVTVTSAAAAITVTSSVSTSTVTDATASFTTTDTTIINTAVIASTDSTTTTTVIPTTVVVTATETVTAASTVSAAYGKRGEATTPVPQWACDCPDNSRLSSACACAGFSPQTVTASASMVTVTVTAAAATSTDFVVGQTVVGATVTVTLRTSAIETVTSTSITSTTSTVVAVPTVSSSTTTTATVGAIPTGGVIGYCADGTVVDGNSTPAQGPSAEVRPFRIEGKDSTLFEGFIRSGPQFITTPSGGTHLCDGTNNNANPAPIVTPTDMIADAGRLCNFGFDGTYSNTFQDFFITRIGDSDSNDGSNRFWGVLDNLQFTPAGGCETGAFPGSSILWAYDAFNAEAFLSVSPASVTLSPGQLTVFTVVDGATGNPRAGASIFDGMISNANGQVAYSVPAGTPSGTYRYKATQANTIRSNAVVITVVAP